MAYIEVYQNLPAHPKTKRLTRELGLMCPQDTPQVVGLLCMFWLYCFEYIDDGNLSRFDVQDLADGAGWTGDPETFVNAMKKAGFLDDVEGVLFVHDWDCYLGRKQQALVKQRARNREKQSRHRERERQKQQTDMEQLESKPEAEAPEGLVDPEWFKVVKCYEKNIGLVPMGTSGEMLVSYYEDLGADVVCKAIEVTNTAGAENPWKYLKAVLNKWCEMHIDTAEKADAYIQDLERRLKNAKQRKGDPQQGAQAQERVNWV